MRKKKIEEHVSLPDATGTPSNDVVTSEAAIVRDEQMRAASKRNEGTPLSHRNRGKAGRKG